MVEDKEGAVKIKLICPRIASTLIGSPKDNKQFETTKKLSGYIFYVRKIVALYIFTYVKVWFVAQILTITRI